MIIYISNEKNKGLLNNIAEQFEWDLLTEVMEKESLNTFITERLQIISDLQYMVIDRSCIKENNQQLTDVIETIRAIWDTKFILLEEVLLDENGEQQKVIYNDYITSLYKYQDNIERNLEYLLQGEKIPAKEVYTGVWIGVMSANSGAGATHTAIHLANFIRDMGESVCYVEANESGDLGAMAEFYEMEQVGENHYVKNGMDYWHQIVDSEKKFAVLDIGKYSAAKMEIFNNCKIKLLVTDGKPYRMADALNVLRYIGDEQTSLWLNYIQETEFNKVLEWYLADMPNPVGRLSWHKSMFQGADALYPETMKGHLNVNISRQSRLAFILSPENLKGVLKHNIKPKKAELEKEIAVPEQDAEQTTEDSTLEKEEEIVTEASISEEEIPAEENYEESISETEYEKKEKPAGISVKENEKIYIKTLALLLGICFVAVGIISKGSDIKKYAADFFFNNQGNGQGTTELVDQDLNINPDIKISVLEVEGADGYEVSYSTDKNFSDKTTVVVEVETADKAVESLTAGKTYYVRVRAFKFNEDGTKVYGEYTEVQKIET